MKKSRPPQEEQSKTKIDKSTQKLQQETARRKELETQLSEAKSQGKNREDDAADAAATAAADAATAAAELVKSRKTIERQASDLEERIIELQAVNAELEAFAYAVSHDLRTPLRAINGFSQAIREDYGAQLDEKAQDYLFRIAAACNRMGQMIDDVPKLSRVTCSDLAKEKINVSEIASEVVAQKRTEQPERSIDVSIEPGLTANADAQLVRIVLENLFDNAWKFTSKQGKAVIEFGCMPDEQETVFFVRDNGVGFDQKYVHKLFNPFQRLHSTEDYPGTGIGLATVKRIVNRHGGKAWAEGKEGKGASFYLTLA